MFTKHDPDDLKPCPHMENLVSAWVDDALTGVMRWYTQWHVSHCPRCSDALPVLQALRDRLHHIAATPGAEEALTPEQRVAVEAAWEHVDQVSSISPSG